MKTLAEVLKGFRPEFGNQKHIDALEVISAAEALEKKVDTAVRAGREPKKAKEELAATLGHLEMLIS